MSQEYFAILTAIGEAKDADAKAGGVPLRLTHMVVGDGAGATPR
ncbi:MAG: phage tail protein, partial [Janthinobacterium sp.]